MCHIKLFDGVICYVFGVLNKSITFLIRPLRVAYLISFVSYLHTVTSRLSSGVQTVYINKFGLLTLG